METTAESGSEKREPVITTDDRWKELDALEAASMFLTEQQDSTSVAECKLLLDHIWTDERKELLAQLHREH